MSEVAKKPIACAVCFFKEHRPPIDEAWIGALMAMVGFELTGLCLEHAKDAVRVAEAMSGKQAATARTRLRVINGGRSGPRRDPPRPARRR